MFRQSVGTTPFSDGIADEYFGAKIRGSTINGDTSFVSTLRALFSERIPDGDSIKFSYTSSSHRSSSFDDSPFYDVVALPVWSKGVVMLHAFSGTGEGNKRCMDEAEKYFDGLEGWTRLPRPTEYYAKTMRVLVFVNASGKNVAIFMDSTDIRKIHFLEAGVLSFFPWYFDPANGFSAEEKAVCESLMKTSPDAYYAALEAMAKKLAFREGVERNMLNEFESKGDRDRADREEREILDLNNKISELEERISSILRDRYERQLALLGLREKIERGDGCGELGDYFSSNKNLFFAGIKDDGFSFVTKGYLSYWDDDLAERVISNKASYLYSGCSDNRDDFQLLYRAVFIDRKIRLRVCAAFRIARNDRVYRYKLYSFPAGEFGTYMPNPHIDRFQCIGDNETVINRCIIDRDFIGAVDQCIAANLNFNFADSTVMGTLSRVLNKSGDYTPNIKAFELPDGTVTDPSGAIAWIKSQSTEENA